MNAQRGATWQGIWLVLEDGTVVPLGMEPTLDLRPVVDLGPNRLPHPDPAVDGVLRLLLAVALEEMSPVLTIPMSAVRGCSVNALVDALRRLLCEWFAAGDGETSIHTRVLQRFDMAEDRHVEVVLTPSAARLLGVAR